jgi:hypothetical protein
MGYLAAMCCSATSNAAARQLRRVIFTRAAGLLPTAEVPPKPDGIAALPKTSAARTHARKVCGMQRCHVMTLRTLGTFQKEKKIQHAGAY